MSSNSSPTLHQFSLHQLHYLSASSLACNSFRYFVYPNWIGGIPVYGALSLLFVLLIYACPVNAQGPAPESAPPLFPGGALLSYDSIFTTRGPGTPGIISATQR